MEGGRGEDSRCQCERGRPESRLVQQTISGVLNPSLRAARELLGVQEAEAINSKPMPELAQCRKGPYKLFSLTGPGVSNGVRPLRTACATRCPPRLPRAKSGQFCHVPLGFSSCCSTSAQAPADKFALLLLFSHPASPQCLGRNVVPGDVSCPSRRRRSRFGPHAPSLPAYHRYLRRAQVDMAQKRTFVCLRLGLSNFKQSTSVLPLPPGPSFGFRIVVLPRQQALTQK